MSGMLHFESSPALGKGGPYTTAYRPWPPEGFTEPTREEWITVLNRRRYQYLRKITTDEIVRYMEVLDWFGDPDYGRDPLREVTRTAGRSLGTEVVDFLHVLRRELYKRPDRRPYFSVRHQRCGMCAHASDRLWEATGETHILVDRNDEPIKSTFVCARCWSRYAITDEEE
jgi:hypothetical protein